MVVKEISEQMITGNAKEQMVANDEARSLVVLTSDSCDLAVDQIIKLTSSGCLKTRVYLKYVEDSDPTLDIYLKKEDFDKKRTRAQEICEKQSKRIMDAGLDVEVLEPYFGIVAQEIFRVEKKLGLDIIVVVAPKMSIYKRMLNGGHFTDELLRKATTPVLVIKTAAAGNATEWYENQQKIWPMPLDVEKAALAVGS